MTAQDGKVTYLPVILPGMDGGPPPRMFDGEPDVMGVPHVARLLDVDAQTVRREIQRGRLRASRVGTRVRITKTALLDYLGEGPRNDK